MAGQQEVDALAAYYKNLYQGGSSKSAAPKQQPVETKPAETIKQSNPLDLVGGGKQFLQGESAVTGKKIEPSAKIPRREMEDTLRQETGVDYHTPIGDVPFLTSFYQADNDKERDAILTPKFGKDGYTKDRYGNVVILPKGYEKAGYGKTDRPVSLIPAKSSAAHTTAELIAEAPVIAGGALAATVAPAGILGAVVYTGVGAMAGKSTIEAVKGARGVQRKTTAEVLNTLNDEFLVNAGGEMAVGGALRVAKGKLPFTTPEQRQAFISARNIGLIPTIQQSLPQFKLLGREQRFWHQLFGNPAEAKNAIKLQDGIEELLKASGMDAKTAKAQAFNVVKKNVDAGEAGQMAMKALTEKLEATKLSARQYRAKAEATVDKMGAELHKKLNAKGGSSANVQQDIRANYFEATANARQAYAKVDELIGKPVVPTQAYKDVAFDIEHALMGSPDYEKSGLKSYVEAIKAMPDRISFQAAQYSRTALRDKANAADLMQKIDGHHAEKFAKGIDKMFTDAQSALQFSPKKKYGYFEETELQLNPQATKIVQEAAASLKEADNLWGKTKRTFDNVQVAALVKQAGERGAVDPSQVVNYVVKPGKVEAMDRVLQLVSPETKAAIQREHFNSMLTAAQSPLGGAKSAGYAIDAGKFQRQVMDMGPSLDKLYGRTSAQNIRKYAKRMADLNANFNLADLNRGDFEANLRRAIIKEEESRAMLESSWKKQLVSGTDTSRTHAMDYVFEPDNPARAAEVIKTFGEKSATVQAIRERGMMRIMSKLVDETPAGVRGGVSTPSFNGENFYNELNKYGRATLNEWYGKETTSRLFDFANTAKYISKKPGEGGGIAAGNLVHHILSNVGTLGTIFVLGRLVASPKTMNYMILGLKQPKTELGKKAMASLRTAVRAEMIHYMQQQRTDQPKIKEAPTLEEYQAQLESEQ